MKKLGMAAVLLLAAAAPWAFGQENQAVTDQFAFYWDVRVGKPEENRRYADIINRAARVSFEQKGFKALPAGELERAVPDFNRGQPLSDSVKASLSAASREQGASFTVLISYVGDENGSVFELRAWRLDGTVFYEFAEKVRSGLELYNRLNDAAGALVSRAGKVAKTVVTPPPDAAVERQTKGYVQEVIVVSGDEGAEIFINGVMKVGVIVDGRLALPFMLLNVGSKLVIEKRKPGFYPDTEEFKLDGEWVELPLRPMERITPSELAFIYTVGQFIGFGAGYQLYLLPRVLSLGAENYFYLQLSDVVGSHTVIHDDVRVLATLYLLSVPGVAFRIAVSTGIGCIFTVIAMPDAPLYTDIYFNLINITVELRIWQIVFFVREEMKLGLGITNNLLGGGFYFIRGEIPIFSFGFKVGL